MATITLKNVPDELHRRLKARAERNRRSLNREAIRCLEAVVQEEAGSEEDLLGRIRRRREALGMRRSLSAAEIEAAIEEGHP